MLAAHIKHEPFHTLAHSESDRLPSPHEGDYTNLCKACKWFILQSTTKGFFFFFLQHCGQDKERERERETLTPAVILTFTTTCVLLCRCQQKRCNKTWWNLCIFFFFGGYNKTKRLHSRCMQPLVISKEMEGSEWHAERLLWLIPLSHSGGAPFRTTALTVGLGSMFRKSF